MGNESVEISGNEARSSIEVTQNAKGQYAFKVKLYFDSKEKQSEDVVEDAKATYNKLHDTFGVPR